ncbi:DUF3037 domain-containing protein [Dysgonomonas sp.]|jgi:hypothetical protein|nr:DUF3037 domain-containing protein [Prevotella sp.]
MQGKHLYEYAVIRVVPRVEREEFINVGLIMFSKRSKFLKARYIINEEKLRLFSTELDMESLRDNLAAFDRICSGAKDGGLIASFEMIERFRWLVAVRSTSVQTSASRMGFTDNLDLTFERLFHELVE